MNAYIRPCWRDDIDQLSAQERARKLQLLFSEEWNNLYDKVADYSDSHGENMSPKEIRAAGSEALRDNEQRAMPRWAEFRIRCKAMGDDIEKTDAEHLADWLDQRETRAKGRRYCRRKLVALIRKSGFTLGVEHLIGEVEWSDKGSLGLTAGCNKALLELPRTPALLRLLRKHGLIERAERVLTPEELWLEQFEIDAMAAAEAEIQTQRGTDNEI